MFGYSFFFFLDGVNPNKVYFLKNHSFKENGSVYMYNWITLLYSRNDHNLVHPPYLNQTFKNGRGWGERLIFLEEVLPAWTKRDRDSTKWKEAFRPFTSAFFLRARSSWGDKCCKLHLLWKRLEWFSGHTKHSEDRAKSHRESFSGLGAGPALSKELATRARRA